ncbi:hypothetical protein EJB05_53322, partial [Eragrostis curvula]
MDGETCHGNRVRRVGGVGVHLPAEDDDEGEVVVYYLPPEYLRKQFLSSTMIVEDDDGVEPKFEDVNEYYFVDGEQKPVCISILHLHFGENNGVEAVNSEKKVYLRGLVDKSIHIYKNVVAWRIKLDAKKPNIFVLSIEKKWIRLLKPRKCYEEFARSVLITTQMMHFFRTPTKKRGHRYLYDHLDDVFRNYDHKPKLNDMLKHRGLLRLIMERDIKLKKSKVLQKFLVYDPKNINKNSIYYQFRVRLVEVMGSRPGNSISQRHVTKTVGNKRQISFNGEPNATQSSDDIGNGKDDNSDDDTDIDNGIDQLCAICDDGGEILSCEGPCKRSFHPTKKDGYNLSGIDIYLCNNCKYKQHQCFKCGELDPSDGSNAKVFQCIYPSCGHYYHPKCIALLLEPDASSGPSLLETRIMEGMPIACPRP